MVREDKEEFNDKDNDNISLELKLPDSVVIRDLVLECFFLAVMGRFWYTTGATASQWSFQVINRK